MDWSEWARVMRSYFESMESDLSSTEHNVEQATEHAALVVDDNDDAESEREALRKQQANANAVADGLWPPFPSEY